MPLRLLTKVLAIDFDSTRDIIIRVLIKVTLSKALDVMRYALVQRRAILTDSRYTERMK